MVNNTVQAIQKTRDQDIILGDLMQQARSTFAINICSVESINQKKRIAEIFIPGENKVVKAQVVIHSDHLNMFSDIKKGDFVLVLNKAGLSPLIIAKVANDRTFSLETSPSHIVTHGLNSSTAGGPF